VSGISGIDRHNSAKMTKPEQIRIVRLFLCGLLNIRALARDCAIVNIGGASRKKKRSYEQKAHQYLKAANKLPLFRLFPRHYTTPFFEFCNASLLKLMDTLLIIIFGVRRTIAHKLDI
jgi:hypothetical protein